MQIIFNTIFYVGARPVQILVRIDPKTVTELKKSYSREYLLLQIFIVHWETWETMTLFTKSS